MSQNVTIKIGGRSYPLVVESQQEESLRKAQKKISEYMALFEKDFNVSDLQDSLAMASLQLASEYEEHISNLNDRINNLLDKTKKINELLV